MAPEFENDLKRMFARADEELPAAQFTNRLMSELLKPRRRERWLGAAALLAAVAFLWFSFPYLEAGLKVAVESALAQSPLLYIYGTALGGYALLWLVRRFQIRLM
jgi:hypothetical protein